MEGKESRHEKFAKGFDYIDDGIDTSFEIMTKFKELQKMLDEMKEEYEYSTILGEDAIKEFDDVSSQLPELVHKVAIASKGFDVWINDLAHGRDIPEYKTVFIAKQLITKQTDEYITLKLPADVPHTGMNVRLKINSFITDLNNAEKSKFGYRYYADDKFQLSLFKYNSKNVLEQFKINKKRFAELMEVSNKSIEFPTQRKEQELVETVEEEKHEKHR
jgi:hypothetical protein